MTRRFGQMLLIGRLLRLTRFGRLRAIARLRVARFLALAFARRLVAVSRTRCRARCACGCMAMASLTVRRARRARGFSGKIGGRHEAVYRNHWNLAFDQALNVSEEL